MNDVVLSPEAFGTLMAMKRIRNLRTFEAAVAAELTARGMAEFKGEALVITDAGLNARRAAKKARERALRKAPPLIEARGKKK